MRGLSSLVVLVLVVCTIVVAQEHLDVHIIAHTHDDVGWLKTVDEYFLGANNSIQDAGVAYILDSVIPALEANPIRKFIYVEQAFFARWWREQDSSMRTRVLKLVDAGQLEMINGGWCMNDEANVYESGIVAQMTRGHSFLKEELGIESKIGWQIDPFGHSNAMASLFSMIGFDAVFFARIDYQDYQQRLKDKALEWVWRPSKSLGKATQLFAHTFWDTTYCYPNGFAFEWGNDPPINNDPRIYNVNVEERANQFAQQMRDRAAVSRHNQILVTYGCDFQYMAANINFRNMDRLIEYINARPQQYGMTVKYSTPSEYVRDVNAKQLVWPVVTNDIFPYADHPHAYWTGYFTSRPALKGFVRTRNNLLHSVNKAVSTLQVTAASYTPLALHTVLDAIDSLWSSFSVAQHHDAVAGTERQAVAYDYAERLSVGTDISESILGLMLAADMRKGSPIGEITFDSCPYLNMSSCPPMDATISQAVPVVAYNPLGWTQRQVVRLPVATGNVTVWNWNGDPVPADLFPNTDKPLNTAAGFIVAFVMETPPMGYSTYFVGPSQSTRGAHESAQMARRVSSADVTIESDTYEVAFGSDNVMTGVTNKVTGQHVDLSQTWAWYNGSWGNDVSSQASGAYIFRPNATDPFLVNPSNHPTFDTYVGKVMTQVTQVWSNWVSQAIRLYHGGFDYVEIEATVGPIPIADKMGKEVITRFQSNLFTNQRWATDSNGREMQQRQLNHRTTWNLTVNEPVSGNYYPMNVAAYIRDEAKDVTISWITDRSSGFSSLKDGQFENMVHRRLLVDDGRGVGQALNETEAIRTTKRLTVTSSGKAAAAYRTRALELNSAPILSFGTQPISNVTNFVRLYTTRFQGLTAALPANVHVLTWRVTGPTTAVLRLRHLYAVGEDADLSRPVSVTLDNLFTRATILEATEYQLTAIKPLSQVHRLTWNTDDDPNAQQRSPSGARPVTVLRAPDIVVTLEPMQVKTYVVTFKAQL